MNQKIAKAKAPVFGGMKNRIAVIAAAIATAFQVLMPAPLAAEPPPRSETINPNYNPVVGQLTRAYIIQQFAQFGKINSSSAVLDIYIIDVDGDGRTTNDQKVTPARPGTYNIGDPIQFIENNVTIQRGFVDASLVTKTR